MTKRVHFTGILDVVDCNFSSASSTYWAVQEMDNVEASALYGCTLVGYILPILHKWLSAFMLEVDLVLLSCSDVEQYDEVVLALIFKRSVS